MNCTEAKEYMMKYLDGERNDIQEAHFRQHLKACIKCSEEFSCMEEIFTGLEAASIIEPPEDFESRVMEKVNAFEASRREKSSRMLVLLYNIATLVSIALLMVFVADVKQGGIIGAYESIRDYFSSFTGIVSAVAGIVGDILALLGNVVVMMFEVFISLIKSFYYIFIALIVLLLAIQRLYTYVAASDGRKS